MKKYVVFLLFMLIFLTSCTGVVQTGNQNLTIEQVQMYAQQTLTSAAAVSNSSGYSGGDSGQLIIRPVQNTPQASSSGLVILSTPTTGSGARVPVFYAPTATPIPYYQQPTNTPYYTNYAQTVNRPCEQLHFIEDVTIPDEMVMAPGQTFRKVWRIQNSGTCNWTSGYQLVYTGGDAMGNTYAVNLPKPVAPGEIVDVSVDLKAPGAYGSYQSFWKLRSPAGNIFGTAYTASEANGGIWVKIIVGNNYNMETVAPGVTPVNTNCTLLSVVPAYRTAFKRGEETDFIFHVRNNSNVFWDTANLDIAYISGENMLKRKANTRIDLPYDVAPGGSLKYALDAVVPSDPGVYTMTMGVVRGYEILCTMDVTVTVVY